MSGTGRPAGPVDPRLWRRTAATRAATWSAAVVVGTLTGGPGRRAGLAAVAGHRGRCSPRRAVDAALAAAPALVAVFAGRAVLSWLSTVLAQRAAAAVKSQLRTDIVAARLQAPTAPATSASLVALVTSGLDALDGYVGRYLPALVLAATVPAHRRAGGPARPTGCPPSSWSSPCR